MSDAPPRRRRQAPDPGAAVRAAAARAVAAVVRGATLDDALSAAPAPAGRDAALLRSLAYGACRWHHRLEWLAAELLDRPVASPELAALVRIGLLQLSAMRIPDHAAVSATVDAARAVGAPRAKGLVNAVLRRYLRERERLERAMADVPRARYSHPDWLIETVRAEHPGRWREILDANNAPPPMWLRVNARRGSRDAYLARLADAGIAVVEHGRETWPDDAILLAEPVPMARLPGYAEGDVSVQDAGAQRVVERLGLEPGQRVLDACAAPGGKAAHMLERCDLGELVAVDRDPARLDTARAMLARLGLAATLVHGDAASPADWWDGKPFDRVLIDAPCSALGVIRRHPDIKLLRTPDDLERAAALQASLLDALWPLLAPGGRLVYVTCTIVPRENGAQIDRFLSRHPDAVAAADFPPEQTLPGEADRDGFYYACIDKQQASPWRVSGSKH
ncbi:MAG TPA: 16S rRNA (cytosine(967)-C(5))-methyltransferase RsmB [Gammaproteobacteria bacterium]